MPRRRNDVAEDTAFLHANNVPPEQWPTRLGMTPTALSRALYRADRPDLARPIDRIRARNRYHRTASEPCAWCGGEKRIGRTYCSNQCTAYATHHARRTAA